MKEKDLEAALKIMIMIEDMKPHIQSEIFDKILFEEIGNITSKLPLLDAASTLKAEILCLEEIFEAALKQGRTLSISQKMIELLRNKQYELSKQL